MNRNPDTPGPNCLSGGPPKTMILESSSSPESTSTTRPPRLGSSTRTRSKCEVGGRDVGEAQLVGEVGSAVRAVNGLDLAVEGADRERCDLTRCSLRIGLRLGLRRLLGERRGCPEH